MTSNSNFSAIYKDYNNEDTINKFLINALNDGWTVSKIDHENIYIFSKKRILHLNNNNFNFDDVNNNDFLPNFINKYIQ